VSPRTFEQFLMERANARAMAKPRVTWRRAIQDDWQGWSGKGLGPALVWVAGDLEEPGEPWSYGRFEGKRRVRVGGALSMRAAQREAEELL
jgi:hypothetical protein